MNNINFDDIIVWSENEINSIRFNGFIYKDIEFNNCHKYQ